MKIELKNIQYSASVTDRFIAFAANLYIGGGHVGFTGSDGKKTYYRAKDPKYLKAIKEAEEYCMNLPPKEHPELTVKGEPALVDVTLETFIEDLLEQYLDKKVPFTSSKPGFTELVYGSDYGITIFISLCQAVVETLKDPKGQELLAEIIKKDILPQLKPGTIFLPENILEPLARLAGFQTDKDKLNGKSEGKD